MATAKPTDVLNWGGTTVSPPTPVRTTGWIPGDNPPAQYANYYLTIQGDGWNTFIDERFESSGASFDTLTVKAPDTAAGSLILQSAPNSAASSTGGLLRCLAGKGTVAGGNILIHPQTDTEVTEATFDGGDVSILGGSTGTSFGTAGSVSISGALQRGAAGIGGFASVSGGSGPDGGNVSILGGTGTNGSGGSISLISGFSTTSGFGGAILISVGSSIGVSGASLTMRAGSSATTKGGDTIVESGAGSNVPSGDVLVRTPSSVSSASGSISVSPNNETSLRSVRHVDLGAATYAYKPFVSGTDHRDVTAAPSPFVLSAGVSGFLGATSVAASDPVEAQNDGFAPADALCYVQKADTSANFLGIALQNGDPTDDILVAYMGPVTITVYSSPGFAVNPGNWFEVAGGVLTRQGSTRTATSIGFAITQAALGSGLPFVMMITGKTA